jgi:transcription-repair coupling factor (superfamily II helicase)
MPSLAGFAGRPLVESAGVCEKASDLDPLGRLLETLDTSLSGDARRVRVGGAAGSAGAWLLAGLVERRPKTTVLAVTADESGARALARDLRFFLGAADAHERVAPFPAVETSPYAEVAPDTRERLSRMAVLFRLAHGLGPGVVVASVEALRRRVLPRETFETLCDLVCPGEHKPRDTLIERLVGAGFTRMPVVEDPGTFAVRGAVLDVFVPLHRYPARLEYADDRVESLRLFDPATQRTLRPLVELFVHPVRETLRGAGDVRARILRAADEASVPSAQSRQIIERLESGEAFLGWEAFVPALHGRLESLLDYLPRESPLWIAGPEAITRAASDGDAVAADAFGARVAAGKLALPPEDHFVSAPELLGLLDARPSVYVSAIGDAADEVALDAQGHGDLAATLRAGRSAEHPLGPLADRLARWSKAGDRVVLQVSSAAQGERLRGLLRAAGAEPPEVRIGDLSCGFRAPGVAFVAEEEIFGAHARRGPPARARGKPTDLAGLKPGEAVVHQDHGIGLYLGLVHLDVGGTIGDFLHLEYAGGDRLYLPVFRLALVSRYRGGDRPPLDRLGGQTFARRRRKVAEDVRKLAEDLLQIYAQRMALPGHGYGEPDAMMSEFEATFPFEETPDQARAIEEVLADMGVERPMDRLVCGDVGFGKTEVAMRACFRAVLGGKQAAVLAPTTVLVEQHLRTFRERLSAWPVRIAGLSRFRSRAEQTEIVRALAAGEVDVVIGTHRLLSPDVRFRDLGLLVVDEEHRFGVTHKERLRKLRTQVDSLALTATPIPRTLQMSLAGIRDMSLIATAPEERLAVRTFVARADEALVREALRRELARGGQVFVVHNRIESLDGRAEELRRLCPEARIAMAHGQMPERELEKVMVDFVGGKSDVLLTTAIIESGLDIPRANTMIVDRADTFGLAQLHQLRGRIGRGSVRAFCYLLVEGEAITTEARARLDALVQWSDLGGGFALATADLDIRGAGELLGGRQSGNIAAVGFDAYARLLEDAVAGLRGEPIRGPRDPDLHVDASGYIPDAYIEDAGQRLDLYKRLAECKDEDEIRLLIEEMRDRYGPEPGEVRVLAEIMDLRARARELDALSLELHKSRLALALGEQTPLLAPRVAELVARPRSRWRLTPDSRLVTVLTAAEQQDRFAACRALLRDLHDCASAPAPTS